MQFHPLRGKSWTWKHGPRRPQIVKCKLNHWNTRPTVRVTAPGDLGLGNQTLISGSAEVDGKEGNQCNHVAKSCKVHTF